jgi:hypothetical protein
MFMDPPRPQPRMPGETPPRQSPAEQLMPGGQATTWVFNPEYQKLVELWDRVHPLLQDLTGSVDKLQERAANPQVWKAPVVKQYLREIAEWRKRLNLYRQAVLTAISDEAADTPRWIPSGADAPHAFRH